MEGRNIRALLALVMIAAGCAGPASESTGPVISPTASSSDPLSVISMWTERRNAGDVDGAMALLDERASIFDLEMVLPQHQLELRELLAAQAIAEWTTTESECRVDGTVVRCAYRIQDAALQQWNLALIGRHEYEVVDGKIVHVARTHDPAAAERVYLAMRAFREWVRARDPEAEALIWSDVGSVGYTTTDGARLFVELLADYESAR